ncbi:MAG: glycosyl transferase family 2 [Proteobacteria bacterium]|nr:MAG: glycosyl transferase family 2 [Pseudomonadota bacterium]
MNKILILLSAYNGEVYVREQLDSIFNQNSKNVELLARDDGSNNRALNTIEQFKGVGVNVLLDDRNVGIKTSYSILLDYALKNTNSNCFMLCDQDDVWKEDKVEKTLQKMKAMERKYPNTPILIHTDLHVTDENLNIIDSSFWHYEHINPNKNSLGNLLMQNTVTGCTMMINRKLAQLALPIPDECMMHDWWIALVTSAFGKIAYVNEQTIFYRQHSDNDTGAKKYGVKNIFKKIPKIINGNGIYVDHLDKNILQAEKFLEIYQDKLNDKNIKTLKAFINLKKDNFFQKRINLFRFGLLKNGILRNIGLFLKV